MISGSLLRSVLQVAIVAFAFLIAPIALAQWKDPELSLSSSHRNAEVGEAFTVQLSAMVEEGAPVPTDPALATPPGFSVQGPQITTQRTMQWINGRSSSKSGVNVTWVLTPSKVGRFSIPSPTIQWNGTRLRTAPLSIEIVAAGSKPRRPSSGGSLFPGGPGFQLAWPFG